MWINKKNANYILIQFRGKGKFKFTFPISLHAFLEVFDAFNDLRKIVNGLFPRWYKKTSSKLATHLIVLPTGGLLELLYELFNGLKELKGLTLVEVELDKLYIKVAVS